MEEQLERAVLEADIEEIVESTAKTITRRKTRVEREGAIRLATLQD